MLAASQTSLADSWYHGVRIGDDLQQPLSFRLGIGPDDRGIIWAVGRFVLAENARSDEAFQAFLDSNRLAIRPGMTVAFQSPGGNPFVGFAIGRMIRAHGLRTIVGQKTLLADTVEPGVCASSCAFAFLGGVERRVPAGSLYGVHDVSLKGQQAADPLVVGQQFGALFTDYMSEMGVDTRLGVDAAQYNSANQDIHYLTPTELAAFRVTTGLTTTWQIEQAKSRFQLVGATSVEGRSQMNRLILACTTDDTKQLLIGIDFLPPAIDEAGLDQSATRFAAGIDFFRLVADPDTSVDGQAPTLTIDQDDIVSRLAPLDGDEGYVLKPSHSHVVAYFKATRRVLDFIDKAGLVRVYFDRSEKPRGDEASFDTDVAAGRAKIADYIASCR
jgi:hypothetical protein